ncbi:hypothetical protein AB1K09_19955 [Solibacillus silvestris]
MKGKRFFKDDVQIITKQRIPDGSGGFTQGELPSGPPYKVFLDTPNAQEQFLVNQMNQETFDRYMYFNYGMPFVRNTKLQHVDKSGVITKYEVVGKPENQGGRDQFMRANLREVP